MTVVALAQHKPPPLCDIEAFTENVRSVISQAQAIAPIIVISIYPFDDSRTQPLIESESFYYLMDDVHSYERRTKAACRDMRTPYLDIYSDWLAREYKTLLADDGFHANSAGHEEQFVKLRKFLLDQYSVGGV